MIVQEIFDNSLIAVYSEMVSDNKIIDCIVTFPTKSNCNCKASTRKANGKIEDGNILINGKRSIYFLLSSVDKSKYDFSKKETTSKGIVTIPMKQI